MKNKSLEKETKELKTLIGNVESSGVNAWKIGDKLIDIKFSKLYKEKFNSFDDYTKDAVGIASQTVNKYIYIRENFKIDDLNQYTIISYLLIISNFDESTKKNFLIIIKKLKEDKLKSQDLNEAILQMVAYLTENGDSIVDIEGTIDKVIDIEKKKKKRNSKDIFGPIMDYPFLKSIQNMVENEPIDEQGLVGLFCASFQYLREFSFIFENKKSQFLSIKYIRNRFPDASVRCKYLDNKNSNWEMQIEFEFDSTNYIKHKHTNCDLIICWNDDLSLFQQQKRPDLPPRLSLKKLLETGELIIQ